MIREEYLRRLVDEAFIEIYLSGNDGARIYWPWRMLPTHEATQRYRNSCEKFIVDSAFTKPELGNQAVLDKALALNAEFVVLEDVYQDMNQTVEKVVEGYTLAEEHAFDGEVIIPLQEPHTECYDRLLDRGVDPKYVALGGVKDATASKQVAIAKRFYEASDDVWVHGLGWGLRKDGMQPNELVTALHENPALIDSIDYSTPVQETTSPTHSIDTGEEMSSIQCAEVGTWLIRDLRRVSNYAETTSEQKSLGLFETV